MAKTLDELAGKAEVSRRTLSRVLKNDSDVADETRNKIRAFLKDEKYYPNIHAASLASKKKAKIIGLVFPEGAFLHADHYVVEILRGVSQAAEEKEFKIMFFTQGQFETSMCLSLYKSRLVGGLALVGISKNEFDMVKEIKKERIPFVLLNSHCNGIDSFDCDNKLGGYIATRHLIKSGRKRIAFIHAHKEWVDAVDRFKGYKKALKQAKIPFRKDYVGFGSFATENAELVTEKLLGLNQIPEAIFAANDKMAMGAINVIRDKKLKIPQDISVVGFDDIPACRYLNPSITTVRQPLREIALLGTKHLVKIMLAEKKTKTQMRFVKPELVMRKSA